jgi:hypothetical protein
MGGHALSYPDGEGQPDLPAWVVDILRIVFAAIAIYGFVISLGGQKLLSDPLGER